jgi:hypothetical protein
VLECPFLTAAISWMMTIVQLITCWRWVQSAANDSRAKIRLLFEEKYKIERKNPWRNQFFQTSPGFKRVGK